MEKNSIGMKGTNSLNCRVVTPEEWLIARKQLLVKEKELTRRRDQLNAELRELPWVMIGKDYFFDGPEGKIALSELFGKNSQLVIRHFMFGPGWKEGCPGCSFAADNIEGGLVHLEHHDVSFVMVSRATVPEIEAFKKRMGWRFKWVSSFNTDFNYDFHVSFTAEELEKGEAYYNYTLQKMGIDERDGMSVFYRDDNGDIFHTYSTFGRGSELVLGTYMLLDITPKGRNEASDLQDWVRHHDKYETGPAGCCCSTTSHQN
jgi:predicted dithiol-disulfide oxidoreductase (DUF899 family)